MWGRAAGAWGGARAPAPAARTATPPTRRARPRPPTRTLAECGQGNKWCLNSDYMYVIHIIVLLLNYKKST